MKNDKQVRQICSKHCIAKNIYICYGVSLSVSEETNTAQRTTSILQYSESEDTHSDMWAIEPGFIASHIHPDVGYKIRKGANIVKARHFIEDNIFLFPPPPLYKSFSQ